MTVTELLDLLAFPDYRHICVRYQSENYAGGGLVPDVKRRFGDMNVLRGDFCENAFIIYVTL